MISWDQLIIQFNSATKPKKLHISIAEEESQFFVLNFFEYAKIENDLSQIFRKIISEWLKNSRGQRRDDRWWKTSKQQITEEEERNISKFWQKCEKVANRKEDLRAAVGVRLHGDDDQTPRPDSANLAGTENIESTDIITTDKTFQNQVE